MQLVMQNYSCPNEINTLTTDGSVVVQSNAVFINYDGQEGSGDSILVFDSGSGKWKDTVGRLWDEFEIRPEGDRYD
jgi:hypothetical protein